jgi:hypothetical protein
MAFPAARGLTVEPVTFGCNEFGTLSTVKGHSTYVVETIYS